MYQAQALVALFAASATAQTIVIPSDSFSSFDTYWNYLYPWGTDHNGGARMSKTHVSTSEGHLVLTSEPFTGEPPAEHGGGQIPINYLSGAVHAKETFTVAAGGGYDFSAEFIAPVATGTWPAFWVTATEGWPPEIDIAEWKGSGDISFNTFNTSSEVTALDVPYPNPGEWHSVLAEVRDANGVDISVDFYLDGEWIAKQGGASYVGEGLWFIINYQMEGSSGSSGPSETWSTIYTYIPASSPNHKTCTPLYVVDTFSFKPSKPHLILHFGPDRKTSPAAACSWILATSRTNKIGLGDVNRAPGKVIWEDLKQETFRGSEFSWGMDLDGRREEMKWKKTAHHAVDGKKASSWSSRNWKLVSKEDNDRILCVFTSEGKLTTVCGTLQFNVDWGQEFEYMVLITVAYLHHHDNA